LFVQLKFSKGSCRVGLHCFQRDSRAFSDLAPERKAPPMHAPDHAIAVAQLVRQHGGRALLVGGWVRDALLGHDSPDLDLEVSAIPADKLESLLAEHYRLDRTGRAFGILKLHGENIDISVPRRETKTGSGHRGFLVDAAPDLPFEQAAMRRDFTINAMGFDPLTNELLDPCGGRVDLTDGILRHTSGQFAEDPLRVLRGMQFCARFELTPAPETIDLCRTMDDEDLAPERIWPEWRKLILLGLRPSLGLAFLRRSGWLRGYPELAALVGVPQDPRWHPEGEVWVHVLHCMDEFAAERLGEESEDIVVGLAVLCHDLGKPATTTVEGDAVRSRGHAETGEEASRAFMTRLGVPGRIVDDVVPLVLEHSHPQQLFQAQSSHAAVRRLAQRVGRIDRLARVVRADMLGRPPLQSREVPVADWLLAQAGELGVLSAAPAPLIQGRHLLAAGLEPGPKFKSLLDACYAAQLDGEFGDETGGMFFLRGLLPQKSD